MFVPYVDHIHDVPNLLNTFVFYVADVHKQNYPLGLFQFSALAWFIKYIYYRNLHFLNNAIIIKTEILLPQAYVTLTKLAIMFRPFVFIAPKDFKVI